MSDSIAGLLVEALIQHRADDPNGTYDELLRTVTDRATAARSLGKADIGSLVMWKRITAQTSWAADLGMTPDAQVREATRKAWAAANDALLSIPEAGLSAREALFALPGMGGTGALASAVVLACAPGRMAVWDRRVGQSMVALGCHPGRGKGRYGRYLAQVCVLATEMQEVHGDSETLTPRHVDLALYEMAASKELLTRAYSLGGG